MTARVPTRADTAVVGGGLMGLSAALALARRGRRVVVLERESVGRHASSATAGGVRSLNRHPAEIALALAGVEAWAAASADLRRDVGFQRTGQIRVAEDDTALAALERRRALTQSMGYVHEELIGANALADLEPRLARHCRGALVVRSDGFADPLRAIHAFRTAAEDAGATIHEGAEVLALIETGRGLVVETSAGAVNAGQALNAAGAWGNAIASAHGEAVPMTTRALQMTVTAATAPFVRATIGSEGRKLSLKQGPGGHVVIGGAFEGLVDETARAGRPIAGRVAQNLANAVRLFPHLETVRVARTWAGLEGVVEDGLPVIGPSAKVPGLFHAFGFSAHGFALAPLIGPILADIMEGETPAHDVSAFAIDRFSKGAAPGEPERQPLEVNTIGAAP